MKKTLLIDAHSLIHRCFHALPPLTNIDGESTGALYGVANILLKIIQSERFTHAAALFDRPEPTFRKERYNDYKIHRPKAPDELIQQLVESRNLFKAFSIPTYELAGYEGDDLIGTFAVQCKKNSDVEIVIFTGDHDSLQLVDSNVFVETFKKGLSEMIVYKRDDVFQRLGVYPEQVIDYKALVGDTSDNIPGVAGIGPKTAATILQKFKTLENYLIVGGNDKNYKKIIENKDKALLSQELATIRTDVPLPFIIEDLLYTTDYEKIKAYCLKQGFTSISKRLSTISNTLKSQETNSSAFLKTKKNTALPHNKQSLFDSVTTNNNNITTSNNTTPQDSLKNNVVVISTNEDVTTYKNSSYIKAGYDLKPFFKTNTISPPYFDIAIALSLLGITTTSLEEATSKIIKSNELTNNSALYTLFTWCKEKITTNNLETIFNTIELPLIPILAHMEQRGIYTDKEKIATLQKEIQKEIDLLQKKISAVIGASVNLNSPKQLLEAFTTLLHIKIKSTDAQTLQKYVDLHPILKDVLYYRELFKLKTTYCDVFDDLTATDPRIHPTFIQLGAATGRLSCQNPNLQNIPQESAWSKKLRDIFIPQKGFVFVSFDYSQIELRILAYLSNDSAMIEAFKNGDDIHRLTAERIYGVSKDAVTPQMRRTAKTLNFGIIYGMGSRSLAQQSGLTVDEAKQFIERYFNEFPSIKDFQQTILAQARANKRVTNENGRFRLLPSISSPNSFISKEAERVAVNMPTQSLAADILKKAMIAVDTYVTTNNLSNKVYMLLTIHDELLFEIDNTLLTNKKQSRVILDIQRCMESAYPISVPLTVDISIGPCWGSMEK